MLTLKDCLVIKIIYNMNEDIQPSVIFQNNMIDGFKKFGVSFSNQANFEGPCNTPKIFFMCLSENVYFSDFRMMPQC